jgi:hypothetical protein
VVIAVFRDELWWLPALTPSPRAPAPFDRISLRYAWVRNRIRRLLLRQSIGQRPSTTLPYRLQTCKTQGDPRSAQGSIQHQPDEMVLSSPATERSAFRHIQGAIDGGAEGAASCLARTQLL